MDIKDLTVRQNIELDKKLKNKLVNYEKLVNELRKKKIPSEIVNPINQNIEEINSFSGSNKELGMQISASQSHILKLIENKLKLVPKDLYVTKWMIIGIFLFGIPIGMALGASLSSMTYLAIGIPIGMMIGVVFSLGKDNKAKEEGRQLDLKIKNI